MKLNRGSRENLQSTSRTGGSQRRWCWWLRRVGEALSEMRTSWCWLIAVEGRGWREVRSGCVYRDEDEERVELCSPRRSCRGGEVRVAQISCCGSGMEWLPSKKKMLSWLQIVDGGVKRRGCRRSKLTLIVVDEGI